MCGIPRKRPVNEVHQIDRQRWPKMREVGRVTLQTSKGGVGI
tara:strand:+ start:377 stop:502 length:126 start_codon:yes stop_codon:yes gene_type:complete